MKNPMKGYYRNLQDLSDSNRLQIDLGIVCSFGVDYSRVKIVLEALKSCGMPYDFSRQATPR